LKFIGGLIAAGFAMSLPAWGEWIEIVTAKIKKITGDTSLSPHGESGLKLWVPADQVEANESLPAWGEWIEI